MPESIKESLERTSVLLDWIDGALADAEVSTKDVAQPMVERMRVSAASFHQVIEHAFAIERLYAEPPHYGSAFALLRPLFEGLIRGLWLLHAATPTQAKNFIEKDQLQFKFKELVERVEKAHPGYEGGQLSKLQEGAWEAMCSYAHGGALQIQRRIIKGEIRPNYQEGELLEVLQAIRLFSLFAAFEIAALSNREQVYKEIIERVGKEVAAA